MNLTHTRHFARLGWAVVVAASLAMSVSAPASADPPPAGAVRQSSDTAGDGPRSPAPVSGDVLGVDPAAATAGERRPSVDPSGAVIFRKGRYAGLAGLADLPTAHLGTNNRRQVVGSYLADGATLRGFVRNKRGKYEPFDAVSDAFGTLAFDINDHGSVVGLYADADLVVHGFVRRPNGTITTVDVPGAQSTGLTGINNRGAVVGNFVDRNGRPHGFLLHRGVVTRIDPPDANQNAGDDPLDANVAAFDINDHGQIVGFYPDARGTFHGFLYHKGRYTRIDPPDASDNTRTGACDGEGFAATAAFGINNHGRVVGQYVDANGVLHGYLWKPKRGFTTIDPPHGAGTVAVDINDRDQILLPARGSFAKGDGCF
jgi:probable HAF family extracellular repeat protein